MGSTDTYGLTYPEPDDLVKDGAAAIQGLAETTEAGLLSPLLFLAGDAADADHADGRLTWNTGTPLRQRGTWGLPSGAHRAIPPQLGYYLVTVQFPFNVLASTFPTVRYRLTIGTRSTGGSTTLSFADTVTLPAVSTDPGPTVTLSTVVECDTATEGIEVVADTIEPFVTVAGSTAARMRIHQLSRIGV